MGKAAVLPVRGGNGGVAGAWPKAPSPERSALEAVARVSSFLDSEDDLPTLVAELSKTIATLTGASRVAFWRLGARGTLAVQIEPHGFPNSSPIYSARLQLGASGNGAVERMVFADELELRNGTSTALDETWRSVGLPHIRNSIAAAWLAGERRLGAIVLYDSPAGFAPHDLWVLRLVGMAAGVVWEYRESEDELSRTAARLDEALALSRLLKNVAAGGDEARRRFAAARRDDSLQLLTGAELQLEMIRRETESNRQAVRLDELRQTLRKVEDSLNWLLTIVP